MSLTGWGVGNWLLKGFGMLLFWSLVVGGIVWLVRNTSSIRSATERAGVGLDKPAGTARASAQDILDERYARGEISDEEYRTRRDILASR